METFITSGWQWITKQLPGLSFLVFIIVCTTWITIQITNFESRLSIAERSLADINDRQLPEIRMEIKQINSRLDKIETRLDGMEARMERMESRMEKMESRIERMENDIKSIANYLMSKK